MCSMCVFGQQRFTRSTTETPLSWTCHLGTEMPRKKDKESREFVKDMAKGKREKEVHKKEERVLVFCLLCHKLFKGYVSPTTHGGMRVKVLLTLFS